MLATCALQPEPLAAGPWISETSPGRNDRQGSNTSGTHEPSDGVIGGPLDHTELLGEMADNLLSTSSTKVSAAAAAAWAERQRRAQAYGVYAGQLAERLQAVTEPLTKEGQGSRSGGTGRHGSSSNGQETTAGRSRHALQAADAQLAQQVRCCAWTCQFVQVWAKPLNP